VQNGTLQMGSSDGLYRYLVAPGWILQVAPTSVLNPMTVPCADPCTVKVNGAARVTTCAVSRLVLRRRFVGRWSLSAFTKDVPDRRRVDLHSDPWNWTWQARAHPWNGDRDETGAGGGCCIELLGEAFGPSFTRVWVSRAAQ
jgi:hypothetical protein